MAITSLDTLIGSSKVIRALGKTAGRTTVAGRWFTTFDVAGSISGVLAGGETTPPATTSGRVPTDTIPGYPDIPFTTLRSYLARVAVSNTVASTIRIFDRLFVAGAYAFNASIATVSGSWASRVSYNGGAADYAGLELWAEQVTAGTLVQNVNVTYTNQAGTTGRTTGAVAAPAAMTVGQCWQLPLQAGDSGLQAIGNGASPSVVGTVASAGTFNVMVLRPLVDIYIAAGTTPILNWADLALPEIFNDSALYCLCKSESGTALGTIAPFDITIANG